MKKCVILFLSLGLFSFGFLNTLLAQTSNQPNITISLSPADPEPGEAVTITVESYEVDLDRAFITWTDGKSNDAGYGHTSFDSKAGEEGTVTSVTASIKLEDGTVIQKNTSIEATSADIIWEAVNGYKPPFYMGKTPFVKQGTVRVSAVNVTQKGSKPISYKWSHNGQSVKNAATGLAGSFIEFTNDDTDNSDTVAVNINNGSVQSQRTLNISPERQNVLFYEYHPLWGMLLGQALSDKTIGYNGSVSILAVPMGFSKKSKTKTSWNISGQDVPDTTNPLLLAFKSPAESGLVEINADISSVGKIFQEVSVKLGLNY